MVEYYCNITFRRKVQIRKLFRGCWQVKCMVNQYGNFIEVGEGLFPNERLAREHCRTYLNTSILGK